LKGCKVADIGCAAGLFSEDLAKIGADVTGIDACKELIDVARDHAALTPSLSPNLRYLHTTVEDHVKENSEKYDALVCSEVIEHVDNQKFFVEQCVKLVKPNGSLVFTTINRNWFSGFNAIIWNEYIMRLIPRGTHTYSMFISSDDLAATLEANGCEVRSLKGFNLKLNKEWKWKSSPRFWYALHAVKKETK
jgi:polyprenyldihydroxybenzoate methyltransferase/3-demethylubiquinol 3-O-methyltransferase